MTNAVMPLCPAVGSTVANTTKTSASLALVIELASRQHELVAVGPGTSERAKASLRNRLPTMRSADGPGGELGVFPEFLAAPRSSALITSVLWTSTRTPTDGSTWR